MKWEDFYEDYYDLPYIKKIHHIKELTNFTSNEELVEVINDIGFNDKKLAGQLLLKAANEGMRLTGEDFMDVSCAVDEESLKSAIRTCESKFTADDIDDLIVLMDYDWCMGVCKNNKLKHPDFDMDEEDEEWDLESEYALKPQKKTGLLSFIGAMLDGGLDSVKAQYKNKFNVGDHVYVIPRGQEGNIIDIVGDTYMVSIGNYKTVERYREGQLRRSF